MLRRIPAPTRIAKNGSTKMRCRDSGEAEPPSRAARNAATGTPTTHEGEHACLAPHADEADERDEQHDGENRPPPAC